MGLLVLTHEKTGLELDSEPSAQGITLEAVLDENLCTPPEHRYMGAVRVDADNGRWRKAVLGISGATSRGRRIVGLTLANNIRARAGEALTMKFSGAPNSLRFSATKPSDMKNHNQGDRR